MRSIRWLQLLLAILLLWIFLQMIISATMLHHVNWQPQSSQVSVSVSLLGSSASSSSSSNLARSTSESSSLLASPSTSSRPSQQQQQELRAQHQRQRQQAEYCLQYRGTKGHWVLDWDYAAIHQYPTFGNFPRSMIANQRFQGSQHGGKYPYLPFTAYRWQEDTYTPADAASGDDLSPRCSTPLLTADGFCRVAAALNVTRVYTAGDSLTEAFASSFRALLGFPKWASIQFLKKPLVLHCNVNVTINATATSTNWTVTHIYRRVQTANTDFEAFFRDASLRETRRDFLVDHVRNQDGGGRTLMVVNVGAHVHSSANFSTSFKHLLQTVDHLLSADDVVFFRNSVAGHAGCWPRGNPRNHDWRGGGESVLRDEPYHNYSEYLLSKDDDPYDWNLLEEYNAHAARMLQARGHAQQQQRLLEATTTTATSVAATIARTPVVHLLNVWNATILRRDGHVGFDDCLHYNLPGPTDWWVHFWYAALQDLAVLEQLNLQ
jgi:hypothetical protein